jgi:hypothetical protein
MDKKNKDNFPFAPKKGGKKIVPKMKNNLPFAPKKKK